MVRYVGSFAFSSTPEKLDTIPSNTHEQNRTYVCSTCTKCLLLCRLSPVAWRQLITPGSPEARIMRFLWRKSYQGHGISILVLLLYNVRQALDTFLSDEEITMLPAIVFALVLIRYAFTISAAPPPLATKGNSSQPTMTR